MWHEDEEIKGWVRGEKHAIKQWTMSSDVEIAINHQTCFKEFDYKDITSLCYGSCVNLFSGIGVEAW